jgi:hypothetical protein
MTIVKTVLVLDDIDKPIKGAEAIRAARGNVETLRQTFYALENGHIPARKRGRIWETTLRLLMNGSPTPASTTMSPGEPSPPLRPAKQPLEVLPPPDAR